MSPRSELLAALPESADLLPIPTGADDLREREILAAGVEVAVDELRRRLANMTIPLDRCGTPAEDGRCPLDPAGGLGAPASGDAGARPSTL